MAAGGLTAQTGADAPNFIPPVPTVVTVTARATPLTETSAAVTVLTREDIERSHAESAADLLRSAPFLQFAQSGGAGGMATITIRGSKPNYVLVLIDGIPANDITTLLGGSFDFSALPLDNIEQIEIVRGPLSAMYGSDAIGGVINFISKKGGGAPTLDASGDFGSFLQRQVKLSGSGGWKALRYSAAGSYLASGDQVEKDGYSTGSIALNGSLSLGRKTNLDFLFRYLDDQRAGFPAGSGGPEFAILRQAVDGHAHQILGGASLKGAIKPWWLYSLDADRVYREENDVTPAVLDGNPPTFRSLPSSTSDTDFGRTRVGATSTFLAGSHLSATLGASVRQESGSAAGFLGGTLPSAYQISRTSLLANAQVQYTNHRLTATAGFGFDKSTGYGEVTSPLLGVNWRVNEAGLRLKASWAEGFKLPSFYALADPNVGNPALGPERNRSFDTGVEQRFGHSGLSVSATYFRSNFENQVNFSSAIFKLVNLSAVKTQGVEFEADYAASPAVRFGVDFAYTFWELRDSADPLRNIPHATGGVHANWRISRRANVRGDAQFVSRRYDFEIPVPAATTVGGYTDVNLSADYELNPAFTAYVRGDNVLDSHFHEYIGFPNPGISVRVGVIYHVLRKP
jgi:outer membrane cobalamin receptor